MQFKKQMHVRSFKQKCGVKFFKVGNFDLFFTLSKIYSTEFCIIFSGFFFLLLCIIKVYFYEKKHEVTGLVFKINAIDGKMWV